MTIKEYEALPLVRDMQVKPNTRYASEKGYRMPLIHGTVKEDKVRDYLRSQTGCYMAKGCKLNWHEIAFGIVVVYEFTTGNKIRIK